MDERRLEAEKLLCFLKNNKDNRGIMADLRSAFVKASEYRSWPHIAKFCRLDNDYERIIVQTVAASYAVQPMVSNTGNIGSTMLFIVGKNKESMATYERRFQNIIACYDAYEICKQLKSIVYTFKAKEAPINYIQLYCDLFYWKSGKPKLQWAGTFWGAGESKK